MPVPDPIADPGGYQEYLVALLDGDDPAEVQAATPSSLRMLVADAGDDLYRRPAEREWSVFGCLAHLTDAELVMSARYRFILAHDQPPIVGYDQDRWVEALHPDGGDPLALLDLFEALRTADVALWKATTPAQRARVGMHAERGPESLDLAFRMIGGHDRFHLHQAEEALAVARTSAGPTPS
jgi:DinB superfamily